MEQKTITVVGIPADVFSNKQTHVCHLHCEVGDAASVASFQVEDFELGSVDGSIEDDRVRLRAMPVREFPLLTTLCPRAAIRGLGQFDPGKFSEPPRHSRPTTNEVCKPVARARTAEGGEKAAAQTSSGKPEAPIR